MTTIKQWDFLNRPSSISSSPSSSSSSSFSYLYNQANQRVQCNLADASLWKYEYDPLGQVRSGKKYWSDWTPVAGQQFEYGFDDIGNRTSTKAGGDPNGAGLRSANYTANNLNQYTTRDVPGAFDVIGLELATNSVTVNSSTPYRKGEYFRKEIPVSNGSVPVWQSVTVAAPNETTVSGNVFVPKTQENFGYDADRNMTNDGRWYLAWDAENRLIKMTANTVVGPQVSLQFDYDSSGRRIRKQVWPNTTWNGSPTNDLRFVYDGWNLIATLNSQLSTLNSFLWGLDLSGSPQGAGGVGGLLAITDSSQGSHFAAFDGNGNVAVLVSAVYGTNTARYEYGPFGEVLRATGPMARANPFRFSTKYQDDETDLLYYGYRYYNAGTGRWNSRDPEEEDADAGGLYAFAGNTPVYAIDELGLKTLRVGVGFDTSARASKGNLKILTSQAFFLQRMLLLCSQRTDCDCDTPGCTCGGGNSALAGVGVAMTYDYNRKNKPAPKNHDYDLPAQRPLMLSNLGNISAAGAHVLVTRSTIHEIWEGHPVRPAAVTEKGVGVLYDISYSNDYIFAHELGHYVGYVGNDATGFHSTDPDNLMNLHGGNTPDCQWCHKIASLVQ